MIYKFDEYVAMFPKKNVSTLKKFVNEAKNLHEMSTEEINAIIATWGAATSGTASNQKSVISLYFDWLTENGVAVAADINSIIIPVKSAEFLIYSSENLHEYWGKFFASCERQATITGDFFSRDKYLTSYVAGILSFYGLTSEQILALDLSDVQRDGIIGYDLPLTSRDIDVLLEYKGLNELANNKKVSGHKYIRAAGVVNEDTLDRGINHGACESKDKYLKRLLTFRNAYKLGRYAEIYAEEKRTGKLVDLSNRAIPADWFLKKIELIVGGELKGNRITAYKKDYDAYRSERMAYEAKNNAEFLIYSSENLHEYWEKFFTSCERQSTITGDFFSRDKYLTSYVAGILSFYGLTSEQILALDLSDVQRDGIIGYDLPLTQTDIDVLLEYKGLNELANNKKVSGHKYIRAAGVVNEDTLDRGINHGACESKDKYLKRLLTFRNAYKLGRYAEIYAEEKRTGKLVDLSNRAIPADWFLKKIELIVGGELKGGRITAYKKDYEAYRSERMEYEAKNNAKYVAKIDKSFKQLEKVTEPKPDMSSLLEALKYVDAAISEVDKIKVNLLGIKAQIQKFVK